MSTQMTTPPERPRETLQNQPDDADVSDEQLFELLGDSYTRRVLEAVSDEPRTGSEVVEAADVSKATAYRRLNDLQEAGLVETELVIDPDGHHHERYHAVLERIELSCANGLECTDLTLSVSS
jgi:DNA-binding transcriptional ArsR family regulator